MITVIVIFRLPQPLTTDEARKVFLSTAPKYQGVAGLIRKYYVLSEHGDTAGGVYLWRTREQAEAMYTREWRDFVRGKYGTEPEVNYLACPVVVDNLANEIIS